MKKITKFKTLSALIILITISPNIHATSMLQNMADFFNTLVANNNGQQLQHNPQYSLTRRQAKDYIDLAIASFDRAVRPNITTAEVRNISNAIHKAFDASSEIYIWVSGVRFYDKDKTDQYILGTIIEHIETTSYTYAYSQTHDVHIAKRIAEFIRNKALLFVQQSSTLNPACLKPFFGYSLQQKIRDGINLFNASHYTPSAPTAPNANIGPQVYTSDACCVCYNTFGGTTQRIYLSPCGHDICVSCALNWFFPNDLPDKTRTCPLCRSHVNFEKLYDDVL